MPQPALKVAEYLSTPLPALREQYPPGTGGTGPRSEWPEGTLRSVQVIDDFADQVRTYIKQFPEDPVKPHPAYKYPKFIQAITNVPSVIKSPSDLQKALSTLPLAAVSSVLTALDADPADLTQQPAKALDEAGHESDGGEEPEVPSSKPGKTKPWSFRFNKSPLGSGEFYLLREGSEKVHLVVRTINSSAFTAHDWDEYVVSGKYNYNTKSKASWYWSRAWGASKRLDCHYYILTDWKRWVFGKFDQGREHGWVSPIQSFDTTEPAILQSLFFWSKSAIGEDTGFKAAKQDPSSAEDLFPDNPARRVSTADQKSKGVSDNKVKAANESDIEESDAE